jgi:hypothetical protein
MARFTPLARRMIPGPGLATALLLLGCLAASRPAAAVDGRDVLGVAHAGGKYNFTGGDYLNEGADRILDSGSRVIKVFLVAKDTIADLYSFNSDWKPFATDVVVLAQKPYFQELFAKPFSTFLLVVPAVTGDSQFLDGLSADEAAAESDQMYRLAKYLLTQYADSGKTFVIQNWEGDHLLYQGLAKGAQPGPVRVQGMIDWINARQAGVRRARQEVGARNVDVVHAAEVNFLAAAMAGDVTMTNNVIPFTHCDLYSYSSWDLDFTPQALTAALDYLKAKAPDSGRFGAADIYLGELGAGKGAVLPGSQRIPRIRELLEAALGWGVRYAVYWEIFSNEPTRPYTGRPTNDDLSGFWLIRPDGVKVPLWNTLGTLAPAGLYRISLRSFSNQYVSVDPGTHAVSARKWLRDGAWEAFTLKDWSSDTPGAPLADGDEVSLQAHDGRYLAVQPHADGQVFAPDFSLGPPERFTLHKIGGTGPIAPGDELALEVHSGRFLGADLQGRGAIRALRYVPGPAETFEYVAPER